ncbi:prolyl oligopeptidase family serine peptidase [Chitinophaga ginsengisegetis]|uniref:prolyl oligopeptidase family serine peptidase n=1 Tax=Chitinophaga ginsengisegetis TaxID=393003 RepID=UPI000DBAA8AF|nr:prolyl oligopeptidase family serine peptidase [Chitinophaga ginsengisegetis]MDR6569482.1 prolyl oligopeptidase [Chitinophaga ginsengisegetis]MDR6649215.1 prolyl oligopeptidase [Chitinophaga ginsengisegetis]MDR6655565.1 prolyl oligopeptidase [Chitinophaga ginsengisegetis]
MSVSLIAGQAMAQQQQTITYPETKKVDTIDNYHGTQIADPYRWLEDDHSPATKAWVDAQNKVTENYLSNIPFRAEIRKRLEELWNYPKNGAPTKHGNYYYFFKNDGLQNQSILYRSATLGGTPEVFLDPNKLSAAGTTALGSMSFSKDGKHFAYLLSKAGSDWQEGFVMDVETRQLLSDKLEWVKFSGLSWKGNGFYYSRYDKPDEQNKLSQKNEFQKVYYHRLGDPQEKDELIYVDKEHPLRNAGVDVTEDERFLILSTSEGTSGRELWFRDLQNPAQKEFTLLVKGFANEPDVIDNDGDKLLVRTNHNAPNYKIVLIDPANPAEANWKVIVPEKKEALQGVGLAGGKLFLSYLKDASTRVYQYDYKGKLEHEVKLPGLGTASGFGSKKEDKEFFYTYTSFITPPAVYKYEVATGISTLYNKAEVKFNPAEYETKQVFFKSADGERVPVFLSYKKGIRLNGNNPVLLYGYGGFNIAMTPSFSVSNLYFMEQGGIYAVVSLRGGSEYGEAWHKAGMMEKKQNVFNDFIGAAEYLIKAKYTNPGKIAIRGGSNGGLLVGACMTQRPELFKVALPAVGVMDMLRFQKFTIGWAWAVEYGSSDNAEQFKYLLKYSPLHNLKPGTAYPATLITTADHDDRVVPAHSFKFAATLQADNAGPNPTLIRIETQAGHGAGKPTSKMIDEAADIWAFTMYNLGMHK